MLQHSISRCAALALAILCTVTVLAGCGAAMSGRQLEGIQTPAPDNAFVLDRAQLSDFEGSLLTAMIGRVPGLRVDQNAACPAMALQGHMNTMPGVSEPQIYVDGARAGNTCVLGMLRAGDVERVEVYSSGVTSRPGYLGNAHGLILIFMRDQ
jgi:hypothetical protein